MNGQPKIWREVGHRVGATLCGRGFCVSVSAQLPCLAARASTGGRAVRHARFYENEDHKGLRIVLRWMTRYTEGGAK